MGISLAPGLAAGKQNISSQMKIRVDLGDFRPAFARCKRLMNAVGTVNPRPPGLHNDLIQAVKKALTRLLAGYARPQREFNLSVVRCLDVLAPSIVKLQKNFLVMDDRLSQSERSNTALTSSLQKCTEVLVKLESLANSRKNVDLETAQASMEGDISNRQASDVWHYDFEELRSAVSAIERPRNAVSTVNPQPSGLIEGVEKLLTRSMAWYARPQREFILSVVRSLDSLAPSIVKLRTELLAMDERLTQMERDNLALTSFLQKCTQRLVKLEWLADTQRSIGLEIALVNLKRNPSNPLPSNIWIYDGIPYVFDELSRVVDAIEAPRKLKGTVNRLPSESIEGAEKLLARLLDWYTRPLYELNVSVSQWLEEFICAVRHLAKPMTALHERLVQAEDESGTLAESVQEQLALLHERVRAITGLRHSPNLGSSADKTETGCDKQVREVSQFYIDTGLGKGRTTYIIGLFGTGRTYINELIVRNVGQWQKYFRDSIGVNPGPTSMIYSGHITIKYPSRGLILPHVMRGISETVRLGYSDVIFLYRHPLDSLLTNWIWWRTRLRGNTPIPGSQAYKNGDDLSADLEQNFMEFKAFAEGDPKFFAAAPGEPFLSFAQFVEETELHLQSATLSLRIEDFMIDPAKEFLKIIQVMSVKVNPDLLRIAPPRTRAFGYLTVAERAPRFRNFIDDLDAETKQRMEKIGYSLT